ncbi:hypothetical protein BCV53_10970 [Parageobacillus thermoglucosidasius]|uniref:Uncharacterized protein n=1 Tax=Parageobacillus thermoglucosidasius TaxID=1426 RepID=A0AAN1D6V0_PARTM|nr:hypothetical protein AOT13_10955 [Parageobacillus thermoglucosidasius]REK53981.1 MAG: hypothetical protein C6P36_15275 [Geobacillus sp.]GAJ44883.1 hypothetical protein GT2_23_00360 [Parageobacillus thermoglucosidasius NBRC 107763]ANZ30569.1 hypothetical protein BCV53_10970 [Parageobacillus thermoglucosidasius]APM81307.1 hypothetical protein BCV54_10980 [Parageobacillus thermoglucosidasius]
MIFAHDLTTFLVIFNKENAHSLTIICKILIKIDREDHLRMLGKLGAGTITLVSKLHTIE